MDVRTLERVGEVLIGLGCLLLGGGLYLAFGMPALLCFLGGLAITVGALLATAPAGGKP